MEIRVRVVPNAKASSIEKVGENEYRIRVNAKAAGGKANARLVEMLAEYFMVSKSRIRIASGAASRRKTMEVLQ